MMMMMMISFTLTPRERYAGSTTIYISMYADAVNYFLSEFDASPRPVVAQ